MGRAVIPNVDAFDAWWKSAIDRLVQAHPKSEEGPDDVGRPVVREAMDPEVTYTGQDSDTCVTAFLRSLSSTANPFLSSPEELRAAGIPEAPYSR
jgi:hypothetical protein